MLLCQTVALSNVTIFAGAITNMLFNVPRKHPFKAGPIIDYDLLLLVRHTVGPAGQDNKGQPPATDSRTCLPASPYAEVTLNVETQRDIDAAGCRMARALQLRA